MNIKSAAFVKGVTGTDEILYDGKFQIVFLGRSNVGKSTLINSLLHRKNLARTSSNPGKTIRMDFFLVNESYYFVDFPGYGYAKRNAEQREKLAKMILWYIMYSEVKNRFVVLIIDAFVGITKDDEDVLKTLNEYKVEHVVIANKMDKVKRGERTALIARLKKEYGESEIIPYSSKEKYSSEFLTQNILSRIPSSKAKNTPEKPIV